MNSLMSRLRAFAVRFRSSFRASNAEPDLEAEMTAHFEMQTADNVAAGMSQEEARRQALIKFGGLEQSKEQVRERRTLPFLETAMQNVRYALRGLRRNPGFAVTAVTTLALGIGANTAVFSIVDAVLLQPLPYRNASQLALVGEGPAGEESGIPGSVMPGEFTDWSRRNGVFQNLAAMRFWVCNLTGRNQTEKVFGARITTDLFPLLQVEPEIGRLFVPEEGKPGHDRVVILSDGLWKRAFGGDVGILGRAVRIDGESRTVIGVMPARFEIPLPALKTRVRSEMWAPLAGDVSFWSRRDSRNLTVIGRLKPGLTPRLAEDEMNVLLRGLEREHPGSGAKNVARVAPFRAFVSGNAGPALTILMAAVGMVLLLACINVANLLLARAIARKREMTVRFALGASRSRVVGLMLTESLLLSLGGAAIGLFLAAGGTRIIVALGPGDVAGLRDAKVNLSVLGFSVALSIVSALLFGMAPAFSACRGGASRSTTEDRGARVLRSSLLVGEMALAMVLTLGAGLLFRDFLQLSGAELGFRPEHRLTVMVSLPSATYGDTAHQSAFFRMAVERVRALPGVESVGAVNYLPLTGDFDSTAFGIDGRPRPRDSEWPVGQNSAVTPGYFQSMGIPLLQGRLFTEADNETAHKAVVINEALARKYFPGEDPIGHNIKLGGLNPKKPWRPIVGVVGNEKFASVDSAPTPEYYLPYHQEPYGNVGDMRLVVRTTGDPMAQLSSIRSAVKDLDREVAVDHFATMDQLVSRSISPRRFNMTLLALFAGLAMAMAAAGIQGVVSYTVKQRTREMGIRIALGARPSGVTASLVVASLRLALLGSGLGLVCVLSLGRVLAGLLYQVKPNDPGVLALVSGLLLAIACVASYLPARRGARVDPMVALRED